MTVREALTNIDIVVSEARMTRLEHDSLKASIAIVTQRCEQADELESKVTCKEIKVKLVEEE